MALRLQFGLGFTLPRADGLAGPVTGLPTNTVLPAITGTAQDGQVLNASNGSWTNAPTGYAYQWKRGGVPIAGATAAAYACVTADVGSTLTCTVTATNGSGSRSATSLATATVIAAAPGGGQLDFTDPAGTGLGLAIGIL